MRHSWKLSSAPEMIEIENFSPSITQQFGIVKLNWPQLGWQLVLGQTKDGWRHVLLSWVRIPWLSLGVVAKRRWVAHKFWASCLGNDTVCTKDSHFELKEKQCLWNCADEFPRTSIQSLDLPTKISSIGWYQFLVEVSAIFYLQPLLPLIGSLRPLEYPLVVM